MFSDNEPNTEGGKEEVGSSVFAPWIDEVTGDESDIDVVSIEEIDGGLQGAGSSKVATIQHLIPHSIMDIKKIGHRVKSYDEQSFPETYMLSGDFKRTRDQSFEKSDEIIATPGEKSITTPSPFDWLKSDFKWL